MQILKLIGKIILTLSIVMVLANPVLAGRGGGGHGPGDGTGNGGNGPGDGTGNGKKAGDCVYSQ